MRKTKDQKDLQAILDLTKEASDAAYSLFSRRLDTQRNVESIMLLCDAVNHLEDACKALQEAEAKATETKSSSQSGALTEIMLKSGRMKLVDGNHESTDDRSADILPFTRKP